MPALALGIPIFDTLFSALRRFLEDRSIFAPDRSHFHHRLLDLGLHQRQAVILIYLATLLAAGLGLLMLVRTDSGSLVIFGGVLLLILLLFRAVGAIRLRQTLDSPAAETRALRGRRTTSSRRSSVCNCTCAMEARKGDILLYRPGPPRSPRAEPTEERAECPLLLLLGWQAVCAAAEQLELAWVSLQATRTTAAWRRSIWRRPEHPGRVRPHHDHELPDRQRCGLQIRGV